MGALEGENRRRVRPRRDVFSKGRAIWVVLALLGGACSSGSKAPDADSAASVDVMGLDAGDAAGDEVGVVALNCQGIRLCMAAGGGVETCVARGTPEAQATVQTLLDCLTPLCPGLLSACVCREACQQPDGYCLDEADACVAASTTTVDAVCGQYCGG